MSPSAFEFSLGRWHNGQFFTLITRSNDPSGEPPFDPDESSASDDDELDWFRPNGVRIDVCVGLPP